MLTSIIGGIMAMTAVLLGAFGAHALKKKFTEDQQQSFETGVRYQFYHALALLSIGFAQQAGIIATGVYIWFFLAGTILFSFSIYGLCLTAAFGTRKWKFLGPITPLGGSLLVVGWLLLIIKML